MIRSLTFAGKRAGSLLWRGVLGMYGVAILTDAIVAANDTLDPPSKYFSPYAITIPNFCAGDDPDISYTRAIHGSFLGQFSTHYDRVDFISFPILPFTSAWFTYKANPLATVNVPLSDFMGRRADLRPGEYIATVEWNMRRRWHSDAQITRTSNPFTVKDCH